MKNSDKPKCYFYTRVSTGMQVEGYSLDAQFEAIKNEAEHRGYQMVRHFSDEGKSGKNTKGREEFRKMLNCIKDGSDGVSYVFVFKLSRFGRNAADVLNSVQLMQDYGVNLYCVKDGIDSASATGKLMISVLSAVAEIERENISEQTMAGRQQKARDGKWNGGFAPYGYKLVYDSTMTADGRRRAGKLEIDEEEAEVIRAIYDKFAEGGIGLGGVAKWLNQKGYTKKIRQNGTVSQFSAAFVKGVLDNPVYMGKIAYGRRKSEKIEGARNEYHVIKNVGFDTYYDGLHDAIVSEELWYRAQEKRKITGVKNDKVYSLEHEHILSSILKCPVCGAGMYGNISRKKKKKPGPNGEVEWYKDQFTYVCKHRKLIDGHSCSFRRQPSQDKINEEVLAVVKEFLQRAAFELADEVDGYAEKTAIRLTADTGSDIKEKKIDLERLKKQYDQKAAAKDKFYEKMQTLDVYDLNYDKKFDDLQAIQDKLYDEMREIDKQICELEAVINMSTEESETFNMIKEKFYRVMSEGIGFYSDYEKKLFLNGCVERVEIFEDDKEHGRWVKYIKFKFPVAFEDDGKEIIDYYTGDWCDSVNHDETVVLLSREKVDGYVSIDLPVI